MAQAPSSSTPTVELHATSKPDPAPPDWLPQAALIAHWFVTTGFLPRLTTALRLLRGRAGDFIGLDFAFALLLYAISAAPSLKGFYSAASSVASLLAGLWQRDKLPSRSALSRGLDDLTHEVVAAVEALFFEALLLHGCKGPLLGGIRDRAGPLTLCFDLDGTRKAVRQRALAQGPQWPEPRRRFREVCKPGYTDRQRGEVVRTRSVLLQAHTQEWMGTWGVPGEAASKRFGANCECVGDAIPGGLAEGRGASLAGCGGSLLEEEPAISPGASSGGDRAPDGAGS